MRFLKNWGFIPILLLVFVGFLLLGAYLSEANQPPAWATNTTLDPLDGMDHHNALICGQRMHDAKPFKSGTHAQTHFYGGGSGQQITLFTTKRGPCGELNMTRLGNAPVKVMLNPDRSEDWQGFTVTAWIPIQPTNVESSASYAWGTASMTERSERWWAEFSFRSANEPITALTLGVE